MPIRMQLNESVVREMAATGGRVEIEDEKQRHLYLRVTEKGHKSWSVFKRVNGTLHRVTLGDWPAVKVEKARKKALKALGDIADGKDPGAERRRKRAVTLTVREALTEYLDSRKLAERTVETYEADVAALLGEKMDEPIADLDRDALAELYKTRSDASPSRATGGARALRAVFNYLRRQKRYKDEQGVPLLPDNPVAALTDEKAWNKIEPRSDRLYDHQLADWWRAVGAERADVASYFHVLLLTGLRRSEAMSMRWEWVDFDTGIITIPAQYTKAKRTHKVYMGEWLKAHLAERKTSCETRETGEWVFPGHVHGKGLVNPEKPRRRISKRAQVPFTPHTLRRTFASIAQEQQVHPYVIRDMLNHSRKATVTDKYAVVDPAKLREAMQKIEDAVLTAAGTPTSDG